MSAMLALSVPVVFPEGKLHSLQARNEQAQTTHNNRIADLKNNLHTAIARKMSLDIMHKTLLKETMHKMQVTAPSPPPPAAPGAPPPPPKPPHAEKSNDYKAKYEESEKRRLAQMALCEDCKAKEEDLIAKLDTAKDAHATAEEKSELELAADEAYETAKSAWEAKRIAFADKKALLACSSLTVDSDETAFTSAITLINDTKAMASEETALEGTMNAKLDLLNEARNAYVVAKGAATAADDAVDAAMAARTTACAGLGVPPSPPTIDTFTYYAKAIGCHACSSVGSDDFGQGTANCGYRQRPSKDDVETGKRECLELDWCYGIGDHSGWGVQMYDKNMFWGGTVQGTGAGQCNGPRGLQPHNDWEVYVADKWLL